MIESKIDINKVFKEGFDVSHVNAGVSALASKRLSRLLTPPEKRIDLNVSDLKPPLNTVISDVEESMMEVLRLFAHSPSSVEKRISAFKMSNGEQLELKNVQWLQPALGMALLMPGDREKAFVVSKHQFNDEGGVSSTDELAAIAEDPKRITIIVFNAASMLFSWSIPPNSDTHDQNLMTILFEEIRHV